MSQLSLTAKDIAAEVVECFSELHPEIRMNRKQWADLMEMIERQIVGDFGPSEARLDGSAISAADLLNP